MRPPNVKTEFVDSEADITYELMAYRHLTYQETLIAVHHFHARRDKRYKLKPGTVIQIHTFIGLKDRTFSQEFAQIGLGDRTVDFRKTGFNIMDRRFPQFFISDTDFMKNFDNVPHHLSIRAARFPCQTAGL